MNNLLHEDKGPQGPARREKQEGNGPIELFKSLRQRTVADT